MNILFFDTETTGIPRDFKAPYTDVENWPRIVQIGFAVYDERGEELNAWEYYIKPNGYEIPADATAVHGITQATAMEKGAKGWWVLGIFEEEAKGADLVVGHNIQYDVSVIGAEFVRLSQKSPLEGKKMLCTMRAGTAYCNIPGKWGKPKWPKLDELYWTLFRTHVEGATQHTALADCRATARCYFAMKEKGIV